MLRCYSIEREDLASGRSLFLVMQHTDDGRTCCVFASRDEEAANGRAESLAIRDGARRPMTAMAVAHV